MKISFLLILSGAYRGSGILPSEQIISKLRSNRTIGTK